jgi:hypothetical protein
MCPDNTPEPFEVEALRAARSALAEWQPALSEVRLSAQLDALKRYATDSGLNTEISITIWRGDDLFDLIETFIVRSSKPVATTSQLRDWLDSAIRESIDDVRSERPPE